MALSVARDGPLMLVYAAGIGIGYGLTFFASTILLLDYFGRGPNLELFSTVNLISTVGCGRRRLWRALSPIAAGSFVPAFVILAVLVSCWCCWRCALHEARRQREMRHERRIRRLSAGRERRLDRLAQHARCWMAAGRRIATPPLIAEEEGLDFVMSMGKWRGFGGDDRSLGQLAGIRHHDGGRSPRSPNGSRSGPPCTPSCTIRWWRRR